MKRCCILLMIAICPVAALACFCPSVEHACEAYRRVPIIFAGTVVDLDSRETNPNTGSYSQQMQFAVGESFKGTSADRITVTRVHRRTSCPSTAPEFVGGVHYLVWAFPDEQGNPVVSDCTVTRRLDDAAQLISELRDLRAGHGPTYIFGKIVRDRVFPNGVRQEDLANYSSVPLAGTKVVVSSTDSNYTIVADQHGHFVLPLERGGRYRVAANLPTYFLQEGMDREVDIEEHECANMSLWTQYAFPFRGRVVDMHGEPVAGIAVELLSATEFDSFARSLTNSAGEYELQAPEPGDYLVAVNWDELPSEMHFATALFPGVQEVETATPVHTQEAGPVVLPDFRLPTPVECAVQIRIDDRDGRPSKDARILTKHFLEQFWHPTGDVTPRGTAIVTIVGPSPTYVVASRPLSIQQELRSDVTIIKSCSADPIHFRLTKTIQVD